jgi:hypothetical protein
VVAGGIGGTFALFGPALEARAVAARVGELGAAAGLIGAAHAVNSRVDRVAERAVDRPARRTYRATIARSGTL